METAPFPVFAFGEDQAIKANQDSGTNINYSLIQTGIMDYSQFSVIIINLERWTERAQKTDESAEKSTFKHQIISDF